MKLKVDHPKEGSFGFQVYIYNLYRYVQSLIPQDMSV